VNLITHLHDVGRSCAVHTIAFTIFLALVSLTFVAPPAHAQLSVEPSQVFQNLGAQVCGGCTYPSPEGWPYRSSLGAAWQDAENYVNGCSGSVCYTATNLHRG
jgi:hypothetical protein